MHPYFSYLTTANWCIYPGRKEDLLHLTTSLSMGLDFEPMDKSSILQCVQVVNSNGYSTWQIDEAPPGCVAVVKIHGILVHRSRYSISMEDIAKVLQTASDNPHITSILLDIDSPGGMVSGTYDLCETIRAIQKPVLAYISGMCCSAAYWLASAADSIIASNTTCEIGSIGVMSVLIDDTEWYAKNGIKKFELLSNLSQDKNQDTKEILQGKPDRYIKEVLDPLALTFHEKIKEGRKSVNADALTGKVYFADAALSMGLIDKIGNFLYSVEQAESISSFAYEGLAVDTEIISINKNDITMKKLPLLMGLLALSSIESSSEGVYLSVEQLETIESALKGSQSTSKPAGSQNTVEMEKLIAIIDSLSDRIQLIEGKPVTNGGGIDTESDYPVTSGEWGYAQNK